MLLQWLVWPLPLELPSSLRIGVAVCGGARAASRSVASAFGLFRGIGQDPAPWTTTPEIVTEGIYRMTRNPMYVGMARDPVRHRRRPRQRLDRRASCPLVLAIVYAIAVRHEEAYLERKFGEGYLVYKRSVRRWL